MPNFLQPGKETGKGWDYLTVPAAAEDVVVVVPDVGGSAAHQPRLWQLDS